MPCVFSVWWIINLKMMALESISVFISMSVFEIRVTL